MQSACDVSYIKEQPGRFSLWRDNTTLSPVITLAQATAQGYMPNMQQALPAPAPLPAIPPQQQQQQLMPPPFFIKFY